MGPRSRPWAVWVKGRKAHTASWLSLPLGTRMHLDKEVALSCGVTFRGHWLGQHTPLSLKLGH